MRLKLKLAQKISLLVIVLIIFSIGISVSISGQWYIQRMEDNLEQNTLNVVKITALSPIIIEGIASGKDDGSIQTFIEKTQQSLEQIDVMVVADKNGIRYGHTKSDRVGEMFSAEDNDRAVLYGETYVSVGPGTLGDSMRAFTPILDADGTILGFVMAGTLLDSIVVAKQVIYFMTLLFILAGSGVGILGALFLSHFVKKRLLNYEPEDIARLYLENQGILAAVHEGVIAIDQNAKITLINDTARQYLMLKENCIGQPIQEVFPLSKLPEVLESGEPALNVQYALNERIVVSNNVPIINDKHIQVGGVSSFRDQTEMTKLAEEMTGVKKIVDSLRATTHEFKNKLHVILGFIEMDQKAAAKEYIGNINNELQETISVILNNIHEPTIAALLIGKSQRCHELKIQWTLDENSFFSNSLDINVNSLVIMLGNFIDNAMDELDTCSQSNKLIEVLINDEADRLILQVKDNGRGIKDSSPLFEKGFTSKEGSRGYGLYLVKEQVDAYQGKLMVDSAFGKGSCFRIEIEGARK